MFRSAFSAVAALPARTQRAPGRPWALALAGGAAATAGMAARKRREDAIACAGIDWVSATAGGAAVGLGMYVVLSRDASKKQAQTFEQRLRDAYNKTATARAVLAETPNAHPDLIRVAFAEEGRDISDTGLAVANHIRGMWADILSEAFHYPKSFFISVPAGDKVTGERTPVSNQIGRYKLSIQKLKHNKKAVELGVDKLAEAFDRNHDGAMDFHEFATIVLLQADFWAEKNGHKKRSKADILCLLYSVLDDNGDGKVTRDEFESFLVVAVTLGIATVLDTSQYCRYWKEFDADHNDDLSYQEFLIFAKKVLNLSQFEGEFPTGS